MKNIRTEIGKEAEIVIKPVNVYDNKYFLYNMIYNCDYDVYDVIKYFTEAKEEYKSGGECVDIESNKAVKKALGITTSKDVDFDLFGCTAFLATDSKKTPYMGRNYDYASNTSCMLIHCTPQPKTMHEKKYKSIACAALSSLKMLKIAEDGNEDSSLKLLPFVCLDGINEKGVSIAILVAGNTGEMRPTYQDADKSNIFTTLAVRLVLDCAATTEEAVGLLSSFNMFANGSKDYHFFISDTTGDSRIVEYDYRSDSRQMIVTKTDVVTNFYVYDKEQLGHGQDRYKIVKTVLAGSATDPEKNKFWEALDRSSQRYNPEVPTSNTQWSILFNNIECSAEIVMRRYFKKPHHIFYVNEKTT